EGLPAVPVLGHVASGVLTLHDNHCNATGPASSLFVKPICGSRGAGTMVWQRTESGNFRGLDGKHRTWQELRRILQNSDCDLVLQPLLINSEDVHDLANGGLSAARIVTGMNAGGSARCLVASYKMSWRSQTTNTLGLSAAVDLPTGRLGRAYSYRPTCPGFDRHPETGAFIIGRVLAEWKEAVDLACKAHSRLSGYRFLGWDIAFTTMGVLLLEGNSGWDVTMVQKPQQTPVSAELFAILQELPEPAFQLAGL
ncbi:MAG: hypothetical protein KDA89_05550, partial [Planctomycetaceae bacterium]|nr:hypothetical protein [Planctomycetaceae bacterium]